MRYQVGPDGEILKCTRCGEWLRSSPIYDSFPICGRKKCKDGEEIGRKITNITGGESATVEQTDPCTTRAEGKP